MQATGSIDKGNIELASNRSLNSIICNRTWITIGLSSYDWYIQSFSPNLELVNSGGPVRCTTFA